MLIKEYRFVKYLLGQKKKLNENIFIYLDLFCGMLQRKGCNNRSRDLKDKNILFN